MISVLGQSKAACDGLRRREMLRLGGLSLLGMSLPELLRAEATLPENPGRGKAKSVILLYLYGGPAVQETFDPKRRPSARGEFGSIPTSLPGVHFCEHLPRMAKWMDAPRSSVPPPTTTTTTAPNAYTMTGAGGLNWSRSCPCGTQAPSMNAMVEYSHQPQHRAGERLMPCTWLGPEITRPGPFAGWLGRKWDPLDRCGTA